MMCYSVQPRDRIFVKGYRFFLFLKISVKIFVKNISKNLSGKQSKKLLDHAKQLQCLGHMLLAILTVKKLLECFTKKNCKKANQKKFRFKKVVKRKGDKQYVK